MKTFLTVLVFFQLALSLFAQGSFNIDSGRVNVSWDAPDGSDQITINVHSSVAQTDTDELVIELWQDGSYSTQLRWYPSNSPTDLYYNPWAGVVFNAYEGDVLKIYVTNPGDDPAQRAHDEAPVVPEVPEPTHTITYKLDLRNVTHTAYWVYIVHPTDGVLMEPTLLSPPNNYSYTFEVTTDEMPDIYTQGVSGQMVDGVFVPTTGADNPANLPADPEDWYSGRPGFSGGVEFGTGGMATPPPPNNSGYVPPNSGSGTSNQWSPPPTVGGFGATGTSDMSIAAYREGVDQITMRQDIQIGQLSILEAHVIAQQEETAEREAGASAAVDAAATVAMAAVEAASDAMKASFPTATGITTGMSDSKITSTEHALYSVAVPQLAALPGGPSEIVFTPSVWSDWRTYAALLRQLILVCLAFMWAKNQQLIVEDYFKTMMLIPEKTTKPEAFQNAIPTVGWWKQGLTVLAIVGVFVLGIAAFVVAVNTNYSDLFGVDYWGAATSVTEAAVDVASSSYTAQAYELINTFFPVIAVVQMAAFSFIISVSMPAIAMLAFTAAKFFHI